MCHRVAFKPGYMIFARTEDAWLLLTALATTRNARADPGRRKDHTGFRSARDMLYPFYEKLNGDMSAVLDKDILF